MAAMLFYEPAFALVSDISLNIVVDASPTKPLQQSTYDLAGRIESTTDANGKKTTHGYDDAGRLTSLTDANNKITSYEYDKVGNRTKVIDATNRVTQYEYDALNRLIKTTYPDLSTSSTVWHLDGRKQSETDQAKNTTLYAYDAVGRLNQVTQTNAATEQKTVYGYDNNGNKISQQDAENRLTSWSYDANNRLTSRTLPGTQSEKFEYDQSGNLVKKIDFAGQLTSYTYNDLNQLILTKRADGSSVTMSYTQAGQVESMTVQANSNSGLQTGKTSYSYDAQDRLTKQSNPDGSFIAYAYDANGNISQRSTKAGTINHSYTATGQLASITDTQGKQTSYTYDDTGRLATSLNPNGITASYSYDPNGRLSQVLHQKANGSIVAGSRYTVSANGQRTQVEEFDSLSSVNANVVSNPSITRTYQYDGVNRLTQEAVTDRNNTRIRTTAYQYDKVGNRSSKTESSAAGTESTVYSYDSNDRLTQETKNVGSTQSSISYTWDSNGNLKSKTLGESQTTFYAWNSDQRLINVKQGTSEATAITVAQYSYDIDGNRTQKVEPGQNGNPDKVTNYLVDRSYTYAQTLQETQTQGSTSSNTHYVWGNGYIGQDKAGQISYAHADGLGSIKALTDAAGNTTDTYQYEAFGQVENRTGTTENAYRYTGEYFDDSIALQYNRARWYDSGVGRWFSIDPHPGVMRNPATLHDYVYAGNEPIGLVDPSGEFIGIASISISSVSASFSRTSNARSSFNTFDSIRKSLCKGVDRIGDAIPDGHHLIPKYAGGKEKQDLMDLDPSTHRALHNLLQMAFVANGFPFANKGRKEFEKFMKANPGKGALRNQVILDVAGYMDDMCTGVIGYDKIKPKAEGLLKVVDIFDF